MFALSDFIEAKDAVCFKYIGQMTGRTVKNFDAVGEAFVAAPKVNVYAMGVGPKMVDGRPTEELAVRYYVARKLPRAELSSKDILPARISGIATDIVEADFPEFAVNLRHRHRPMLPGVSVAHIKGGPGTMGCYCRSTRKDDAQEQLYMLSCNHVLAMFNSAKPGDLITQPATSLDGGDARRDGVAGLERFVAFEFGRTGNAPNANRVDAAIARLHAAEQATLVASSRLEPVAPAEPRLGDLVYNSGRTTGHTEGVLDDIALTTSIPLNRSRHLCFVNCLRVRPTSDSKVAEQGDSGSVFWNSEHRPVGLLFSVGPKRDFALAVRMSHVVEELGIEVLAARP